MGRYTTLTEEVTRFKKMALVTEIDAKPELSSQPEDGKEIITSDKELEEHIDCKDGDCTLLSHKGKALGHGSKGEMEKRERQVNYFKHLKEGSDEIFTDLQEMFGRINGTLDNEIKPKL